MGAGRNDVGDRGKPARKSCRSTNDPAVLELHDLIYSPFGIPGTRWGIFDRGRRLIAQSASCQGGQTLRMPSQSLATELAWRQVTVEAPDDRYAYGGVLHEHMEEAGHVHFAMARSCDLVGSIFASDPMRPASDGRGTSTSRAAPAPRGHELSGAGPPVPQPGGGLRPDGVRAPREHVHAGQDGHRAPLRRQRPFRLSPAGRGERDEGGIQVHPGNGIERLPTTPRFLDNHVLSEGCDAHGHRAAEDRRAAAAAGMLIRKCWFRRGRPRPRRGHPRRAMTGDGRPPGGDRSLPPSRFPASRHPGSGRTSTRASRRRRGPAAA